MDLSDFVDRIWDGAVSVEEVHTGSPGEAEHMKRLRGGAWAEAAPDVAFWLARSDVSALRTSGGLVLVDTGERDSASEMLAALRRWSADRVHTVIYSHGHPDHTGGADAVDAYASASAQGTPHVIAHAAVLERFAKYQRSGPYNAIVNRRQFRNPSIVWPTEFRLPDETYHDRLVCEVGGVALELNHGRGETDDHTWVWVPDRKVLCCGDFFMWVAPNAGNPQKSQRYAWDWAQSLRGMAGLGAELLLPGHGYPIFGHQRVKKALSDVADYLSCIHDQTLALMNEGATLDTILHTVAVPGHLVEPPYMRPVFDDPQFVVRNVWRYYGGWYGGDPATLKPAPQGEVARELALLAGGAARLAERASQLAASGELRLASHLAQTAALAAPGDPGIEEIRREIFAERAATERSAMARGIFAWAAETPVGGEDPLTHS
jgi:alkyl sulfatase BDS1-like metallo-beta-lactamase superfamily hydrolase